MADEKRLIDVMPFMKTGWHLVRTGKSNEHLASLSLADVPTVDAAEVVHGRWEWIDDEECGVFRCSCCVSVVGHPTNYCPNCGAKMDGERKKNG